MIRKSVIFSHTVYFSRWNRKGYAIFASLGKTVKIAALSIAICEKALEKSSKKGIVVTATKTSDANDDDFREPLEEDPLLSGITGGTIETSAVVLPPHCGPDRFFSICYNLFFIKRCRRSSGILGYTGASVVPGCS